MPPRDLDLVLLGATGYTGRLVADELNVRAAAEGVRWGLAGRDRAKLEAVRAGLPPAAREVPIVLADVGDPASVDALAARARVVVTTVGPYGRHGTPVVAACARAGTSYADLTGEVTWMRRMIDAHDAAARASGARIVHTAGFDSIPSDLGVWLVHRDLEARGRKLGRVDAYFELRGGASGGTVATMLDVVDEATRDRAARRVLTDPYALDPTGGGRGPDRGDPHGVAWVPDLGVWRAPFVMAQINARVVRRTNALLGHPYGTGFRYAEAMSTGGGPRGLARALAITAGLGAFLAAAAVPRLRGVLARRLPKPGEGPTSETRARGRFTARFVAEAEGAPALRVLGTVGDRFDPGYGSTARMLVQVGLALAAGQGRPQGGVLTPAAALGDALIPRLRGIGFTATVEPFTPTAP